MYLIGSIMTNGTGYAAFGCIHMCKAAPITAHEVHYPVVCRLAQ